MKLLLASMRLLVPMTAFSMDATPDASFYNSAARDGLFEVEVGKLAEGNTASQHVKDFGAMIVKDNGVANEKLPALAGSKNGNLRTSPSKGQMAKNAELEVLSGEPCDKSYMESQMEAHRQAIALFKREIATGSDVDAKAFAISAPPTLRAHFAAIKLIAAPAEVTA
jgi:putative membrane protein